MQGGLGAGICGAAARSGRAVRHARSVADAGALFLPTMLLLMGEANMYQKFFSAKDERAARRRGRRAGSSAPSSSKR